MFLADGIDLKTSETTTVLSPEPRPAPRASLRKRRPASQPRWDIWLILLGTLVVWAFCVGMFLRQERYRVATTPIAEMQLGANVPGVNPGEADDLSLGETIDPATWRKVSLTGRQTDGSLLEIELLRPLAWVDAHRIDGSDRLLLHMGELDFHGEAQLTALDPCPPVRAGHSSASPRREPWVVRVGVVDVRLSGNPGRHQAGE